MRNLHRILLLTLFINLASFVKAYPVFTDKGVIDNHFTNAVYATKSSDPEYVIAKDFWSGEILGTEPQFFENLHKYMSEDARAEFGYALSKKGLEENVDFFKSYISLQELPMLSNELKKLLKIKDGQKLSLMFCVTLYVIRFFDASQFNKDYLQIIGEEYDALVGNSIPLERL